MDDIKIKFCIMDHHTGEEFARVDTYEEAESRIRKMFPRDLMGSQDLYIRKVYTNRKD